MCDSASSRARSIKSGRGHSDEQARRGDGAGGDHLQPRVAAAAGDRQRLLGELQSLPRLAAEDDRHPTAQLEDPTPQQFVVVGLRECLLEVPIAGTEVDRHPQPDRLGAQRARRQQADQLVDLGERSRLLSGRGPMEDRHQPTAGTQRQVGGRGHPQAVARQFSRQRRGTPPGRPHRGLTQLVGHRGIWLGTGQRKVTCPLIGIVDHVDETSMQRLPIEGVELRQRRRRQQRVGTPQHQVVADDQETAGDRRLDRHHAVATPRPSQRRRGARSERRGDTQDRPHLCRRFRDTLRHRARQCRRDRRAKRIAEQLDRTRQLDGEHRVPTGQLVDPAQHRARDRLHDGPHDLADAVEGQRPDDDLVQPFWWQHPCALEPTTGSVLHAVSALGGEHGDRLRVEASHGVPQ